jgi:hypothetical protein
MADTQLAPSGIKTDTPTPRLRLTEEAVAHASRVTGRSRYDEIGDALGLPRMTFWRLRTGTDPRLSLALSLSEQLGWPVARVFERCPHA